MMSSLWNSIKKEMSGFKKNLDESQLQQKQSTDQAYEKALSTIKSLIIEDQVGVKSQAAFTQTESLFPIREEEEEEEGFKMEVESVGSSTTQGEYAVLGSSLVKSPMVNSSSARGSRHKKAPLFIADFEEDLSPAMRQMLQQKRKEAFDKMHSDEASVETKESHLTVADSSSCSEESFRDVGQAKLDFTRMVEPLSDLTPPDKAAPPEPIVRPLEDSAEAAWRRRTFTIPKESDNLLQTDSAGAQRSQSTNECSKAGYPDNLSPELRAFRDKKIREIRAVAGMDLQEDAASQSSQTIGAETVDNVVVSSAENENGSSGLNATVMENVSAQQPAFNPQAGSGDSALVIDRKTLTGTKRQVTFGGEEVNVIVSPPPPPFDDESIDGKLVDGAKRQEPFDGGKTVEGAPSPAKIRREERRQRISVRVTADPWIEAGVLPPDFGKQATPPAAASAASAAASAASMDEGYNSLWTTKSSIGNGAIVVRKLKPCDEGMRVKTAGKFINHVLSFQQYVRDGQL